MIFLILRLIPRADRINILACLGKQIWIDTDTQHASKHMKVFATSGRLANNQTRRHSSHKVVMAVTDLTLYLHKYF